MRTVAWTIFVLATTIAMELEWPDMVPDTVKLSTTCHAYSIASWPSLREERPLDDVLRPSLIELQRLKGGGALRPRIAPPRRRDNAAFALAIVAYPAIGLTFVALLVLTLFSHPLLPLQLNSLSWCRSWLLTTVADYYGAAFCLCGIILASEPPVPGVLWVLACCLLGTPGCCGYVFSRLLRHGTLRLGTRRGTAGHPLPGDE